jgi:hypothetical protein
MATQFIIQNLSNHFWQIILKVVLILSLVLMPILGVVVTCLSYHIYVRKTQEHYEMMYEIKSQNMIITSKLHDVENKIESKRHNNQSK